MKKRIHLLIIIVLSIGGLTTLIGLCVIGVRRAMDDAMRLAAEDAVMMVSGEVAMLYRRESAPTPVAIDAAICQLHNAGVTGVALATAGKPVDLYGTPFRVSHAVAGMRHIVTATSAGPDRVFGTSDDITRVAGWEPSPPSKQ